MVQVAKQSFIHCHCFDQAISSSSFLFSILQLSFLFVVILLWSLRQIPYSDKPPFAERFHLAYSSTPIAMSSISLDYYLFDHDKHIFKSHGGKQRSKREVVLRHRSDPNGHTRKIFTKLHNAERKQGVQRGKKLNKTPKIQRASKF